MKEENKRDDCMYIYIKGNESSGLKTFKKDRNFACQGYKTSRTN